MFYFSWLHTQDFRYQGYVNYSDEILQFESAPGMLQYFFLMGTTQ